MPSKTVSVAHCHFALANLASRGFLYVCTCVNPETRHNVSAPVCRMTSGTSRVTKLYPEWDPYPLDLVR